MLNILIDIDGVLADFDTALRIEAARQGLSIPWIPFQDRKHFFLRDDYPVDVRPRIERLTQSKWLYRGMPPLDGARSALLAMLDLGHNVRLCTSMPPGAPHLLEEKFLWVDRHLGDEFISRIVVSSDKTWIHGDVLIDDNPHVTGSQRPTWNHILFDQPYNRHIERTRLNWQHWQQVLLGKHALAQAESEARLITAVAL